MISSETSEKNTTDFSVGCLVAVYAFWLPKSFLIRWLDKVLKEHDGESYLSALLGYVISQLVEKQDRFLWMPSQMIEGFPNLDTSVALDYCINTYQRLGPVPYLIEVVTEKDKTLESHRQFLREVFGSDIYEEIMRSYWNAVSTSPTLGGAHFRSLQLFSPRTEQEKRVTVAVISAWGQICK